MILINLLPDEYRQKRQTPVKLLLVTALIVALNGSLGAYWAWTAFGAAAEVESELAVLEDSMNSLQPAIDYHRKLEQETRLYQARETTLAGITQSRISWTQKIDQLIDLVNSGGSASDKYLVWLDDLAVSRKVDKRTKSEGSVKAGGHSGSSNFAQVANFLEDLEQSPFSEGFSPPAPPEGSQSSVDEELIPHEVWSFPLELHLLPAETKSTPK